MDLTSPKDSLRSSKAPIRFWKCLDAFKMAKVHSQQTDLGRLLILGLLRVYCQICLFEIFPSHVWLSRNKICSISFLQNVSNAAHIQLRHVTSATSWPSNLKEMITLISPSSIRCLSPLMASQPVATPGIIWHTSCALSDAPTRHHINSTVCRLYDIGEKTSITAFPWQTQKT